MAALETDEHDVVVSFMAEPELRFLSDPFIERLPHSMAMDILRACLVAQEEGMMNPGVFHRLLEHIGVFKYLGVKP